jgi:TatD DNase family protein
MPLPLPPVDAHAHVETTVPARDLEELRTVIFAVTRGTDEWESALARQDELTIWGIGCHPGDSDEVGGFDADAFAAALQRASLVGEVGLDAKAGARDDQRRAFEAILEVVAADPRPISIHSVGSAVAVLDCLERHPQHGAILHWWRGSKAETERAVELGAFFSLNGHEARKPKNLEQLPPDRVLTETDFPFTQRYDTAANTPGSVETIEATLERVWATDRWGVRKQIWSNLESLFRATGCIDRVPFGIQEALLTVPQ